MDELGAGATEVEFRIGPPVVLRLLLDCWVDGDADGSTLLKMFD